MRAHLHEGALWVALVAACVLMVATTPAKAAELPWSESCAADPGPIATSITNDAAIEVHALRRESAQHCAALLERGDGVGDRVELAWVGVWFLAGVLVVHMIAPGFVRAFRFWRE